MSRPAAVVGRLSQFRINIFATGPRTQSDGPFEARRVLSNRVGCGAERAERARGDSRGPNRNASALGPDSN